MEKFVGLDVLLKNMAICILNGSGDEAGEERFSGANQSGTGQYSKCLWRTYALLQHGSTCNGQLIRENWPMAICDDCIARRLRLRVRQHANHKTRELAESGVIGRSLAQSIRLSTTGRNQGGRTHRSARARGDVQSD
jgi:hypothetical protein